MESRTIRRESSPIRFGVDVVVDDLSGAPEILRSGTLGLVTNDAARRACDPEILARKSLIDAGVPIMQLFSPEHGISRFGEDGKWMDDQVDPATGLPVCSLYGQTMRPPAELLGRLDAVLFDIPDIGSRFYTYIWTLSHVLEACAEAGKPLVVLDRVNPVGGDLAASEGPVLDTRHCSSFLGRAPIPVRHSLTAGELACWMNDHWKLNAVLHVIPVEGWCRSMQWPDCDLPFVPTSPAMSTWESALCYPGTCLFEATNLSTGRGTDIPFQQVGAPWLDVSGLLRMLNSGLWSFGQIGYRESRSETRSNSRIDCRIELPGVAFHQTTFTPQDKPWKGEQCQGIRLEITDPDTFRPVRTGLALLTAIRHQHPESFAWRTYPTAANPTGEGHFERLIGAVDIRPDLEADPAVFLESIPRRLDTSGWQKKAARFLIYS